MPDMLRRTGISLPIHGRGAGDNPPNRFETAYFAREPEDDFDPAEASAPTTRFLDDHTRAIIARNDSPDVPFSASINPYRGCEHGCVYCFARPTHEYLGFSAGLDFESKIMVKRDAAKLLRKEMSAKSWTPQTLALSGVTDCYQPIERKLRLTRQVLEVLCEFRNPVCVVTKNFLVTRDLDLLGELARHEAAAVYVSITTLDRELAAKMEPRTSTPARRLAAIARLAAAEVPVGVMVAPCIPGLTDHEMPAILSAARRAGAAHAGTVPLRLPLGVAGLFEKWLDDHFPDRKEKILNRLRGMRGGKLNDPRFGYRMAGSGIFADQLNAMFDLACRKNGYLPGPKLSADSFRVPAGPQLSLFEPTVT